MEHGPRGGVIGGTSPGTLRPGSGYRQMPVNRVPTSPAYWTRAVVALCQPDGSPPQSPVV